ncbi:MAG: aminotransferase class III-fold pyridoxal phosphate-dependent enzyme [Bianqueaceae bacterium]
MLAKDKAAAAFHPGDHASTFGGNPMASTAGLAVLEEIEAQNLTENARTVGAYLHSQAETLAAKHPAHIKGVRGLGLMQGIVLNNPDELLTIRLEAGKRGLLIISAGHDVLRMVPPLIIETKHIDEAMSILDEAFAALG